MEEQNQSHKMEDQSDSLATKLYDAALEGNVNSLHNLRDLDKYILDRCIIQKSCQFMQSPLHVAVNKGHVEFVEEILRLKPELAEVVDHLKRSTPLHIAAAIKASTLNDRLKIVKKLLEVKPSMCFAHDLDGKIPVHVAVVNGNIEVLKMLLEVKHEATWVPTTGGETVLHLCVKNNQLTALQGLVEYTQDEPELLNFEDSNGNTALHLAVAYKRLDMVEYLLKQEKVDKNYRNKKEKTVVDIYYQTNDKSNDTNSIGSLLKKYKAKPAKYELKRKSDSKWLEEQNTSLMVVASLIATMAFQAGMNPPGGVWQDDSKGHEAGTSIMSSDKRNASNIYNNVLASNTIALISSLSVTLLLISGLPCRRYFVIVLRVTLWIAVTSIAITYLFAVGYLTTDDLLNKGRLADTMDYSIEIWVWLIVIILFGHGVRFIWKLIGHENRQRIKKVRKQVLNLKI